MPFAIAALIAIAAWVPNQRDAARRPFELRGFVLCGAALISLLYGTELASHPHASLTRAAGFILAGVLTGLLAVGHVRMGFGLSPFRSGLLLLATATGNLGMKLFATPILRRFGFRAVATVNGSIGAVCILEASTLWSVAQQMTIGMGIAFGALCLRLSGSDSAPFALADFHWAFAAASALALFSVIGYARLARGSGSAIGGGAG